MWFVLGGARWAWPKLRAGVWLDKEGGNGSWLEYWGGVGGCGFELGWGLHWLGSKGRQGLGYGWGRCGCGFRGGGAGEE